MHTPTLEPTCYLAGLDLKLMEFRGWDLETMERRSQRITIQILGASWYVMNGDCCALRRQDAPDPIAFVFGAPQGTPCATPEEALALLTDYLNQPSNPYTWINSKDGE